MMYVIYMDGSGYSNYMYFQYPHSSELCRFHDINKCPELSAAKTSSQEVLNSTRNWRRLRWKLINLCRHAKY